MVAAWRASGLSAVKFCEGKDFTAQRLWHWASKMRGAAQQRSGTQDSEQADRNRVRLARVVRVAAPGIARPTGSPLAIEMRGVRVVVSAGFDRATLSAVLDEIDARAGVCRDNG